MIYKKVHGGLDIKTEGQTYKLNWTPLGDKLEKGISRLDIALNIMVRAHYRKKSGANDQK